MQFILLISFMFAVMIAITIKDNKKPKQRHLHTSTMKINNSEIEAHNQAIMGNNNVIRGNGNNVLGNNNTLIGYDNKLVGGNNNSLIVQPYWQDVEDDDNDTLELPEPLYDDDEFVNGEL